MEKPMMLKEATWDKDTVRIDIWYPPRSFHLADLNTNPSKLEVGLMDTRAADSILIEYDFDRDGYSVKQASTFWGCSEGYDEDWQEVAFIEAWARAKPDTFDKGGVSENR